MCLVPSDPGQATSLFRSHTAAVRVRGSSAAVEALRQSGRNVANGHLIDVDSAIYTGCAQYVSEGSSESNPHGRAG